MLYDSITLFGVAADYLHPLSSGDPPPPKLSDIASHHTYSGSFVLIWGATCNYWCQIVKYVLNIHPVTLETIWRMRIVWPGLSVRVWIWQVFGQSAAWPWVISISGVRSEVHTWAAWLATAHSVHLPRQPNWAGELLGVFVAHFWLILCGLCSDLYLSLPSYWVANCQNK